MILESYDYFLLLAPQLPKCIFIAFEPLHILQTQLRMAANEVRGRLADAFPSDPIQNSRPRCSSVHLAPPTLVSGSGHTLASLA